MPSLQCESVRARVSVRAPASAQRKQKRKKKKKLRRRGLVSFICILLLVLLLCGAITHTFKPRNFFYSLEFCLSLFFTSANTCFHFSEASCYSNVLDSWKVPACNQKKQVWGFSLNCKWSGSQEVLFGSCDRWGTQLLFRPPPLQFFSG